MSWPQEAVFRSLLQKIATKATPPRLERAAQVAVDDEDHAFKHICLLVIKELKQLKPQYKCVEKIKQHFAGGCIN